MCSVLEVSRSQYYEWLNAKPSARMREDQVLSEKIKMIFIDNKCRYGSRRIRRTLLNMGYCISRRRVRKLMKKMDCTVKHNVSLK